MAGIVIEDKELIDRRQRVGDSYIMDLMETLSLRKRQKINKVRQILNLIVVSDLMTSRGDKLEPNIL